MTSQTPSSSALVADQRQQQLQSELAPTLAIFGTASDVGKSLIATGLCRIISDAGIPVAPFKAQNMSNNSCVTKEGAEIGRAQYVQAQAARVDPHVDMNPVLLKPGADDGSQIVLLGRPWKNRDAKSYFADAKALRECAWSALHRLRQNYECVVIEGAGSCAEVNLRPREFVNFPCAHAADAPVVLVADIDRGGVFAQIVGSLEVMPAEDRARVCGVIVNRFRGNQELFADGVNYLEQRTGVPVLGVVPYAPGLMIDAEDGVSLEALVDPPLAPSEADRVRIAVLRLPHISNFTDFDALAQLPGVGLHYLSRPRDLKSYDLVILPGTKSVRGDLEWLRRVGWAELIEAYRRQGGRLGGICGGYQMMGRSVADPDGVEGEAGTSEGFGFFPIQTTLMPHKILRNVEGTWSRYQAPVQGYEIHMGETLDCESAAYETSLQHRQGSFERALFKTSDGSKLCGDGLISDNGRIWGTYLHGLFDSPAFLEALLAELQPRWARAFQETVGSVHELRRSRFDDLADHLRAHMDIPRILGFLSA